MPKDDNDIGSGNSERLGVPASASEERRRYLQLEDFDALFELGRELEANDRREEAEACWHPIAEVHAGGALGMAWIALQSGDDEEELHWTTRAAELGSVGSMHSLGRMLSKAGNEAEAESWWLKAADQGNSDSMCSLAFFYKRSGRLDKHKLWLQRAGNARHPFAMFALGIRAENSEDLHAARDWLELSWESGYELAGRHLMRIAHKQGDSAYLQQLATKISASRPNE